MIKDKDILKEQAHKLIRAKDEAEGESWSNDTGAILDLMVQFYENKAEELTAIIENGTRNRRYYKGWEDRLFTVLGGGE